MQKLSYLHILVLLFTISACSEKEVLPLSLSSNKAEIKAYNLINPKEAYRLLSDHPHQYLPIQISKAATFNKRHIPNALNIYRPDYGADNNAPYGGLIPSEEKLQTLLQNLGYNKGETLLLYDAKANVDALRFAWVLNLYGFDNFKIINGGLKYWEAQDLPTSEEISNKVKSSNYKLPDKFENSILADSKEVLSAIKDTNTLLLDTREDYEYLGAPFIHKKKILPHKKGAFNRGSIPSSIHFNWSRLADLNGDHRIKAEKDLMHDLKQQGITPEKNIILYCHSGSRTSHTYYVLKHVLGFENVKNYDGSWIEWSYLNENDKTIPIQQICDMNRFTEIEDSLKQIITTENRTIE